MGIFSRDHTQGINQQPADLTITVKSDRVVLQTRRGGNVSDGDILLVSYKTPKSGWVRLEVAFQESRSGVEIFTAGKAEQVVVFKLSEVKEARNFSQIRGTVYQPRSSSSVDDLTNWHILFNPLNPFSPFYGCAGFHSPGHICEVHADPARNYISHPLGVETPPTPVEVEAPQGGVNHQPGHNPFDQIDPNATFRDNRVEHEPVAVTPSHVEPEPQRHDDGLRHDPLSSSASDFASPTSEVGAYR